MKRILGVDFDNTLICYDHVFHALGVQNGLFPPSTPAQKTVIRDLIRSLPGGDSSWQQLQASAYGSSIDGAKVFEGVPAFFRECRNRRIPIYIVSHKSEIAWLEGQPLFLREIALEWMKEKGFFNDEGLGLSPGQVFFESSRAEKIERIKDLQCSEFIDDLEEVFLEPDFPGNVAKLLFAPYGCGQETSHLRVFTSWYEIQNQLFSSIWRD